MAHDRHLRRTYGITLADYEAMFAAQQGLCALCKRPERAKVGVKGSTAIRRLHVDHDHVSGKIRALLCSACNTAIGLAGDDPLMLKQAALYLAAHARMIA